MEGNQPFRDESLANKDSGNTDLYY